MLVEGERQIERALRAGWSLQYLFLPRGYVLSNERWPALARWLEQDQEFRLDADVWRDLCAERGANAVGLVKARPNQSSFELVATTRDHGGVLLVLVDVEEPGNVGALVRTALAGGATGVVAVGASDPWHPKAIRTSMGSVFRLPTAFEPKPMWVASELGALARVAAVARGGVAPWRVPPLSSGALIVGSEARGLSEAVQESCEHAVTIPMPAGADSFSVNAATAVLLYELRRPRAPVSGR